MTAEEYVGTLQARVARLEALHRIGQLPIRYASAVDQRDLEAWTGLFVPDVDMGRHGRGRAALRDWIAPRVAQFYRSVHLVCGHRIDLPADGSEDLPDTATGQVYCRAEHEVGDRWIVMAIRYDDVYRRIGDEWLFASRREGHWYKVDVTERPPEVDFDSWRNSAVRPALPGREASWAEYWEPRDVGAVSAHPVSPAAPGSRRG